MPRRLARPFALLAALVVLAGPAPRAAAQPYATPTIVFDYSLDTNGFFSTSTANGLAARAALQFAATALTSRMTDTLAAINPTPGAQFPNTWTADFFNPATGAATSVSNLTIAQNAIVVYAGGRALGGSTLGQGGPGGFGISGFTQEWFDTVEARGQAGALAATPTDFGPWGGAITFNTTTNWNFSIASGPSSSAQSDFLSVAEHELGHLLGIGTAESWDALGTGTGANARFTGAASTALYGSNVPLEDGYSHWKDGTTYTPPGGTAQSLAMDPSITQGTRVLFTELDFAGLSDVGWQITPIPEPTGIVAVGLAAMVVVRRLRRPATAV